MGTLDRSSPARRGKDNAYRAIATALGILILLLAGCRPEPPADSSLPAAPAFSLRQFDGRDLALSDLRNRTVVLNFWASWCVPCREEMPLFDQMWRTERDQGLTFVGVALDDDETSLTSFLRAFNVTYPAGLDFDGHIARAYEVKGLPTTIVISPGGGLVRRWQGPIDRGRLEQFIAEARGGRGQEAEGRSQEPTGGSQ